MFSRFTAFYRTQHPFPKLGAANQLTLARGVLTLALAVLIVATPGAGAAALAVTLGGAAAVLDGLDGWVARRTGMASGFGARFDMEVDALLILALSILCWRHGKAGPWVIASGLLRYAFVLAGWIWPWLRRPLTPTRRGKAICAAQTAALIAALAPVVAPAVSRPLAAMALLALSMSFLLDTLRLWRRRHDGHIAVHPWRRGAIVAAAIVVLNASLTFDNVWPTLAVAWTGKISVELAAVLLVLAALAGRAGGVSRAAAGWLSALWIPLVLARYAEVTAPAVYGRDINLYWDLRFVPDVAAMVIRVAPFWLVALVGVGTAGTIVLLHRVLAWAFGRVGQALADGAARRTIAVGACAVFLLFGAERLRSAPPEERVLPVPVTRTYLRQLSMVLEARGGSKSLPPSPSMASSFERLDGADVFLVFIESYGAVGDQPGFAERLAPARQALEVSIRDTNRRVVSAYVESPTFGGSSWLAHLSLISGIEVRDAETNALLMTQSRDTLVKAFSRAGYRTIGLMPGLRQRWPEGRFYGFDEIYGADELAYTGPEFGWFALPDQFSLARFDALERERPPTRRFVLFPTISTHFPFSPTPPYQPDWSRMLTSTPYDGRDLVHAYGRQPDWIDFAPGYIEAMTYDFAVIGGYLRQHPDRDFVMILLGDHQPPAAVSGTRASWNVPVHVIASRAAVLDRLVASGFRPGLNPAGPTLSRMHALLPILLRGFGA